MRLADDPCEPWYHQMVVAKFWLAEVVEQRRSCVTLHDLHVIDVVEELHIRTSYFVNHGESQLLRKVSMYVSGEEFGVVSFLNHTKDIAPDESFLRRDRPHGFPI